MAGLGRFAVRRETLFLALILIAGAALRCYGLNWDEGQWIHPDERQIYFVVGDLGWPDSLAQALSPDSPLNPKFFAYGSLPIYLLQITLALLRPIWPALRHPGYLHLAGRPLAVLFDLGTIYLTYRLVRTLWPAPAPTEGETKAKLNWAALLAATFVSLAVIHVQLARFYTADPLLTFFVLLTLNLAADVAQGAGSSRQAGLGIALGLALATKISAAPLILVVLVAYHTRAKCLKPENASPNYRRAVRNVAFTLILAGIVFFVTQPYALIDWPTFVEHTVRESEIARGKREVPYTIQYEGTLPFLYSMWQTALWGLVLPLGLAAWTALALTLGGWMRRGSWRSALLLAWAGLYFAATGLLYTRHLRYMLPLVPILCILTVHLFGKLRVQRLRLVALGVLVLFSLVYALAFVSIYAEPHSWISASEWVYRQAPAGSTLSTEHWDMALPLPLEIDGQSRRQSEYDMRLLPLYDTPDDVATWGPLAADLADSDYLIVASRRLYGSIPRVPDTYPVASRYYDLLFTGELGFELAGEYTRGPSWLNPRLSPLPSAAPTLLIPDESFVVYDHPRALILRNVERLPADELRRRLEVP